MFHLGAWINRAPLIYPDSIGYIRAGRAILATLLGDPNSGFYGPRSQIYGLLTALFHLETSLWLVVFWQSLILSFVLFALCKTFFRNAILRSFATISVVLVLFSSAPWFTGLPQPDVFAPILVIATFLLSFAWRQQGRICRVALIVVYVLSVTVHSSHLLLAIGLIAIIATYRTLFGKRQERSMQPVLFPLLSGLVVALLAMTLLAKALYGHFGLVTPKRFPHLLARVIVDGPGEAYLRENCPEIAHPLCNHLDKIRNLRGGWDFLFSSKEKEAPYQVLSPKEKQTLVDTEFSVVIAAFTTYPLWQLRVTLGNAFRQLFVVDMAFLQRPGTPTNIEKLKKHFPPGYPAAADSLQMRRRLPVGVLATINRLGAIVGLLVFFTVIVWRRRRLGADFFQFSGLIGAFLLGNALTLAALSDVAGRYQARVIWLIVLLAAIAVFRARRASPGRIEPTT